jgi:hypothetical protein
VGHLALALGRPGLNVRATLGIISALGSPWRTPAGGPVDRFIQTDTVIPWILRRTAGRRPGPARGAKQFGAGARRLDCPARPDSQPGGTGATGPRPRPAGLSWCGRPADASPP